MRKERVIALGAAAAILLFLLSMMELFETRFEAGDIYPVYSSLRSDAAGTKAYYEAIERLKGAKVERRFDPLEDFGGRGATIVLFGVSPAWRSKKFEELAGRGNRVVLGLPVCVLSPQATATVVEPWDIAWSCVKREAAGPHHYVLTQVGPSWRVIARDREERPIAAERQYGKGSVVVATDAFAFSNEGLLRHRQTQLLTAVLGNNTHIVFDEHHLGLLESQGVVSLARRYRLHGFGAGLLLLAMLFIWRNSSSFLPRIADVINSDEVAGRDTGSGLSSVLRRTIPPREVIAICVAEWKRSLHGRTPPADVDAIAAIANDVRASREPVEAYRRIARRLSERRSR